MSDYIDKVDIEGTQYDIQDSATKATAEQNAQDIEKIETDNVYSFNEVKTNEIWHNGKPIYKKTIDISPLPNAQQKEVNHGIQDLDELVQMFGSAYNPTVGNRLPLPYNSSPPQNGVGIYLTETIVKIQTGVNVSPYTKAYVTLKYTKTTDSPQP